MIYPEDKRDRPYLIGNLYDRAKARVRAFLFAGRAEEPCPWTFLDALAIAVLIAIFVFSDPFHLGANILRFLRLHFFIFTKEPRLLYYLTIYINTILVKCVALVMLIVFVRSRKASFRDSVVPVGRIPKSWPVLLPLYIGLCVLFQIVSKGNPLVPNIPFNSVFFEAKILGNIVIIFSVLCVAPVIEEIIFRGFFYPALNRYLGVWPSIILVSALFTLAHYPQVRGEYVFMGVIFILSLVITYARAKTGSTVLAVIMHFLYNLVCIGIGFLEYLIVRY